MAIPVLMPRQGQSVESCILGQWYKNPGDSVKKGDLLFSYETDKASFEEEAKESGILLAVFFEEGDEVAVLENIAVIGKKGESVDNYRTGNKSSSHENTDQKIEKVSESVELPINSGNPAGKRIKISPLAKKMAKSINLDIGKIKGSGPRGRIIARDIKASSHLSKAQYANDSSKWEETNPAHLKAGSDYLLKPVTNIRKLIAKAMQQSLQNSAQLTHHMSADARKLMASRKKIKQELESGKIKQNITINDLICFAVIKALKKFPQVNTHFLGDKIKWFNKVHLGLAVDTDRGLMVPTIKNADDLSLEGLSSQLSDTAGLARTGNINPDLLKPESASFTVSNLGNYGVEMFTPVINLPQTAILGICAIIPRPKDLGDGVYGFVPMLGLSLTYDHQSIDGGEATLFLAEIRNQIENISI